MMGANDCKKRMNGAKQVTGAIRRASVGGQAVMSKRTRPPYSILDPDNSYHRQVIRGIRLWNNRMAAH